MYCSFVQSWQNTMDALHDKTKCIAMTASKGGSSNKHWKGRLVAGLTCQPVDCNILTYSLNILEIYRTPFSIGNPSSMCPFSMAILVYWSVDHLYFLSIWEKKNKPQAKNLGVQKSCFMQKNRQPYVNQSSALTSWIVWGGFILLMAHIKKKEIFAWTSSNDSWYQTKTRNLCAALVMVAIWVASMKVPILMKTLQ